MHDPRDPHAAQRHAERIAAYDKAMDEYRATDPVARRLGITNCTLCNADGYTPSLTVCDHVDRTETNAAGSEMARQALTEARTKARGEQP
jgi:hypothetical protein